MKKERSLENFRWILMTGLSVMFLGLTFFIMSNGTQILPTAFKLAKSTQAVEDIEKNALGFMNLSMLKPLWEEIWIGVLGLFCAFGFKTNRKYAWALGMMWGAMLMTNAIIQGTYEIVVLDWSNACPQTYVFFFLGASAVTGLWLAHREPETVNQ